MPDLGFFGWIIVGLIAGAVSGAMLGGNSARGCLPNIVVGIFGGLLGGWLAGQMGFGTIEGFFGALIVAIFGSLVLRLVLNAMERR